MGRVGGREMQEGREMGTYCIRITDSLCYKADANTLLQGNYTSIKMFEKKNIYSCYAMAWPLGKCNQVRRSKKY